MCVCVCVCVDHSPSHEEVLQDLEVAGTLYDAVHEEVLGLAELLLVLIGDAPGLLLIEGVGGQAQPHVDLKASIEEHHKLSVQMRLADLIALRRQLELVRVAFNPCRYLLHLVEPWRFSCTIC